jgi:coenzyme F420-0:L-glutamate ligase/coenzyme F420-1:gamma-L-glutamate ligase
VTLPVVADELAGAAELVLGKLTGRPFAVLRGRADLVLPIGDDGPGAA